jgi:hypothetical protein
MTPELQQIIGILIGVLAVASGTLISLLNARKAEAALQQAKAEAEMARLLAAKAENAAGLALGAANETMKARNEFAALGGFAAAGTVSGAPPAGE